MILEQFSKNVKRFSTRKCDQNRDMETWERCDDCNPCQANFKDHGFLKRRLNSCFIAFFTDQTGIRFCLKNALAQLR